MPHSKRNKVVALTQVKKKGKEHKEEVVQSIRDALDSYSNVYVLSYHNMSTNPFKKIKEEFKDSKFFLGKNKLAQFALGKTQEDEPMENVSLLSKHLSGECCLLFTNKKGVEKYFEEFTSQDFANAGTISKVDIKLEKGFEAFEYLSYSIEPYLREL